MNRPGVEKSVPGRSASIEKVVTVLSETPKRLAALTTGLTPVQLRATPGQNEWSANDVLAHLRACADVWGGCILRIVAEERPTLRAVNPRAWIDSTDYPTLEFRPSLRTFIKQRDELLEVLDRLLNKSWSRSATVTGAGAPLERSVLDYAERLARHERAHVRQVERIARAMQ